MDQETYFKDVKTIMEIAGKRVGHNVYLHIDTIEKFGIPAHNNNLFDFIKTLAVSYDITEFNVVKLSTKEYNISLLWYPAFYKKFHPYLKHSTKIGIEAGKCKTIHHRVNRPILHRCETMMIPNSALQAAFCYQTQIEHAQGLYDDISIIGREDTWVDLLKNAFIYEAMIESQNHIASMIRKMPSLPTMVVPDKI